MTVALMGRSKTLDTDVAAQSVTAAGLEPGWLTPSAPPFIAVQNEDEDFDDDDVFGNDDFEEDEDYEDDEDFLDDEEEKVEGEEEFDDDDGDDDEL